MSTYYILAKIDIKTGKTTYEQVRIEPTFFGFTTEHTTGFYPTINGK